HETERHRIYDRDDGFLETSPSTRTLDEYLAARTDLVRCREPEIAELVHQIQIERVDEVMVDETKTELDVIAADQNSQTANNELVALGHKYRAEQETKIQPRRRKDVTRSR